MNIVGPIVGVNIAAVLVVGGILAARNRTPPSYYLPRNQRQGLGPGPQSPGPQRPGPQRPGPQSPGPQSPGPQSPGPQRVQGPSPVQQGAPTNHQTLANTVAIPLSQRATQNPTMSTNSTASGPLGTSGTTVGQTYVIPKTDDNGYYVTTIDTQLGIHPVRINRIKELTIQYNALKVDNVDVPVFAEQEAVLCFAFRLAMNATRGQVAAVNTIDGLSDAMDAAGSETLQGQIELAWKIMYSGNPDDPDKTGEYELLKTIFKPVYEYLASNVIGSADLSTEWDVATGTYLVDNYDEFIISMRRYALQELTTKLLARKAQDPGFEPSRLLDGTLPFNQAFPP